jgi:hypothetical protein
MPAFPILSFSAPWILAALLALPVLWWLLRVTPPQPRRTMFPPLALLRGLQDEEQTPAATPWWLLLLRLIAAALLIAALADPLLGQPAKLVAPGPLVLVIDNGWTAAKDWDARNGLIADLLHSAQGRPIAIIPTAGPAPTGFLNEAEAARTVRTLKPMPWPGDRIAAATALGRFKFSTAPALYWLSDGIDDSGAAKLQAALHRYGNAQTFTPARLPLGLMPVTRDASGFALSAVRAVTDAPQDSEAQAIGARGETLAATKIHFKRGETHAQGHIALPMEVRNATARLSIAGEDSAGAVQLLDKGAAQRSAGIVSEASGEGQPLLSDVYYLERALAPYAEISKGGIGALLDKHVSVLLLADVAHISGTDLARVKDFISHGGVLIRFAGPRLTNGADDLVPVPLRIGGRYLGSAMAWGQPQHLAAFGALSPFNGLEIPGEVTVTRQILAEPSAELESRTWARLTDGTPLITARGMGTGWVVLFHITASPGWSSLPLSGLYVEMLKRLLALSVGTPARELAGLTSLPPVSLLDGFGHAGAASADAAPIAARDFAHTRVSAKHPPGLYGAQAVESALNILSTRDTLAPLRTGTLQTYGAQQARALQPLLLAAVLTLLLLDALLSLGLRGFTPRRLKILGAVLVFMVAAPQARADDAMAMKAALDTRLAYVKTGVADVDATSQAGLTGLGLALKARTSYEPLEPMGIDLERDDLSFYPLLYWPMDPREKNLSPKALSRLNDYMRQGGTILFDTRDLTLGAAQGPASPGTQTLRRLTATLDLPPLEPIPGDHVLTKSFYILRDFPGRWTGGKLWVEALPPAPKNGAAPPARGGDGVSPVIIGGNDWAAAWAVDASGHFLSAPSPGGETQREMAFRFGINVAMYALTGNYKADQVHAPALLERMGK